MLIFEKGSFPECRAQWLIQFYRPPAPHPPSGHLLPQEKGVLSSLTRRVYGSRFKVQGFECEAFSFRLVCVLRIL